MKRGKKYQFVVHLLYKGLNLSQMKEKNCLSEQFDLQKLNNLKEHIVFLIIVTDWYILDKDRWQNTNFAKWLHCN